MRTDLLKEREHAIELLSQGYSIDEVAENMGVTKKHVNELLKEHSDPTYIAGASQDEFSELVNTLYKECLEKYKVDDTHYNMELAISVLSAAITMMADDIEGPITDKINLIFDYFKKIMMILVLHHESKHGETLQTEEN